MLEEFGNIWDLDGDAVVITTNGAVRSDGACVMGRGIAAEAKERYPGIEFQLGYKIRLWGNGVCRLEGHTDSLESVATRPDILYAFPVKHHWRDLADLALIERSARQLAEIAEGKRILVPRPGCGNGGRRWEEVKPIIGPLLDDRFVVVTFEPDP